VGYIFYKGITVGESRWEYYGGSASLYLEEIDSKASQGIHIQDLIVKESGELLARLEAAVGIQPVLEPLGVNVITKCLRDKAVFL
jgi:hypothetical protein